MNNNISNEKAKNSTEQYFTEAGYSADEATKLANIANTYKECGETCAEVSVSNRTKKRGRTHKSGYAVNNEALIYRIADVGLLNKLHGVKSGVTPRVFYFDKSPDIKAIIDEYNATPNKESDYLATINHLGNRVSELEQNMRTLSNWMTSGVDKINETGNMSYIDRAYLLEKIKKEFLPLGIVDIVGVVKNDDGNILSFTMTVKETEGTVVNYAFNLAKVTNIT
ncbi:hypothetical protein SDC9_46665 [bioreactor metagenome]|uniref:Uncharacterized protein n=1 Tax=bioreactor metagenome TaxID=1076179 RepID=A0A644WAD1_9ZZZZ